MALVATIPLWLQHPPPPPNRILLEIGLCTNHSPCVRMVSSFLASQQQRTCTGVDLHDTPLSHYSRWNKFRPRWLPWGISLLFNCRNKYLWTPSAQRRRRPPDQLGINRSPKSRDTVSLSCKDNIVTIECFWVFTSRHFQCLENET